VRKMGFLPEILDEDYRVAAYDTIKAEARQMGKKGFMLSEVEEYATERKAEVDNEF
jgi:hypothetical protein